MLPEALKSAMLPRMSCHTSLRDDSFQQQSNYMTSKSPVYLLQPSPQNDTLWGLLMDALRVLARSSWHGQVSQTRLYKVRYGGCSMTVECLIRHQYC